MQKACIAQRFEPISLRRGKIEQETCRILASTPAKAEEQGVAVCRIKDHESNLSSQCPDCGKLFSSKGAMGSHRQKTHAEVAELTQALCGSVCQVCMVDHRSSKQMRAHLCNGSCRRAYLGADLGVTGGEVAGAQFAWQPPVKIAGPRPSWTL